MVLKRSDSDKISDILNFSGTDDELLVVVNEMIKVYFNETGKYSNVTEFSDAFKNGKITIIDIVISIQDMLNELEKQEVEVSDYTIEIDKTQPITKSMAKEAGIHETLDELDNADGFDIDETDSNTNNDKVDIAHIPVEQIDVDQAINEINEDSLTNEEIVQTHNDIDNEEQNIVVNKEEIAHPFRNEVDDEDDITKEVEDFDLSMTKEEEVFHETLDNPKILELTNDDGESINVYTTSSFYVILFIIPVILNIYALITSNHNIVITVLSIVCFIIPLIIATKYKQAKNLLGSMLFVLLVNLLVYAIFLLQGHTIENMMNNLLPEIAYAYELLTYIIMLIIFLVDFYIISQLAQFLNVWFVKLNVARGYKPHGDDQYVKIIKLASKKRFPVWFMK